MQKYKIVKTDFGEMTYLTNCQTIKKFLEKSKEETRRKDPRGFRLLRKRMIEKSYQEVNWAEVT